MPIDSGRARIQLKKGAVLGQSRPPFSCKVATASSSLPLEDREMSDWNVGGVGAWGGTTEVSSSGPVFWRPLVVLIR